MQIANQFIIYLTRVHSNSAAQFPLKIPGKCCKK